jgi:hypothetical protein
LDGDALEDSDAPAGGVLDCDDKGRPALASCGRCPAKTSARLAHTAAPPIRTTDTPAVTTAEARRRRACRPGPDGVGPASGSRNAEDGTAHSQQAYTTA